MNPRPLRRRPPCQADFPAVKFAYLASADGVDENLLVLFHGLGDNPANFLSFGAKMQLPQTALLAIRGPSPIPYFDDGTGWFPAFDQLGEEISWSSPQASTGVQNTRKLLVEFFRACLIEKSPGSGIGWPPGQIFLLGFAQGGTIALDLALWGDLDAPGPGPAPILCGGVISIAGGLFDAASCVRASLPVERRQLWALVTKDDSIDASVGLGTRQLSRLKSLLEDHVQVEVISGKQGISMPNSHAEMSMIFQFLGAHLALRNLKLEAMSDVVQIN
ncbi:uncharacterized protein BJ171DRAFT_116858 [Polychytrium aggregatum]|uniref:uncharacterized protein n=1 Tax=Polychytrium aggregatum TaxID=110093 RepID=UPI0022FE050B|nr:uncharacterized protein BJ171DRAFT_116858 [Polychytrium aggregatum]KAI9209395.1 hypothetical protein BJ171DRAFT_116858 [Polychytrium aggregatum]